MDLGDLIALALASPAGSIIHAKYEDDAPEAFEIDSINGQKPAEA
jgi:hypothetical protein